MVGETSQKLFSLPFSSFIWIEGPISSFSFHFISLEIYLLQQPRGLKTPVNSFPFFYPRITFTYLTGFLKKGPKGVGFWEGVFSLLKAFLEFLFRRDNKSNFFPASCPHLPPIQSQSSSLGVILKKANPNNMLQIKRSYRALSPDKWMKITALTQTFDSKEGTTKYML